LKEKDAQVNQFPQEKSNHPFLNLFSEKDQLESKENRIQESQNDSPTQSNLPRICPNLLNTQIHIDNQSQETRISELQNQLNQLENDLKEKDSQIIQIQKDFSEKNQIKENQISQIKQELAQKEELVTSSTNLNENQEILHIQEQLTLKEKQFAKLQNDFTQIQREKEDLVLSLSKQKKLLCYHTGKLQYLISKGIEFASKRHYKSTLPFFKEAFELGSIEAKIFYARCIRIDKSLSNSREIEKTLLKECADDCHLEAIVFYGHFFCEKRSEEQKKSIQIGMEAGHPLAFRDYAKYFCEGKERKQIYKQAGKIGEPKISRHIANMYQHGSN
jgi:DNA repair exonuclease SbcCD ATPase subunit